MSETPIEQLNYEEALQELEGIVGQLEGEISDLDQSLALFERGQALAKRCTELLAQAELKVKELSPDGELSELAGD